MSQVAGHAAVSASDRICRLRAGDVIVLKQPAGAVRRVEREAAAALVADSRAVGGTVQRRDGGGGH